MRKHTVSYLEVTLARTIEDWWEAVQEKHEISFDDVPLVGDEIFEIMATAAVSVLRGTHDAQKYMKDEEAAP